MSAGYRSDGLREYKQTGSTRTYYLYSGGVPVCELNADGSVKATNTFGANGLVSRTDSSGSKYYTFDPNGNVTQIVDNSGNVVATLQYDAYGNAVTGSDTNPTPYGFGGQAGYYTDSETGMMLATYRYYDPNEGRWINRDPIGYLGGMDLYAYCDGNPVGAIDPLGLAPRPGFKGYLQDSWDFLKGEGSGLVSVVNPMTYINGARYLADYAYKNGLGSVPGALWSGFSQPFITLWDAKDPTSSGEAFGPMIPAIAGAGLSARDLLKASNLSFGSYDSNLYLSGCKGGSAFFEPDGEVLVKTLRKLSEQEGTAIDAESIKAEIVGKNGSKYNLYVDRQGNLYIAKNGSAYATPAK